MFTRNWYKILAYRMTPVAIWPSSMKLIDPESKEINFASNNNPLFGGYYVTYSSNSYADAAAALNIEAVNTTSKNYKYASQVNVYFGDGNEAATLDDVKLSGDIVTGFSVSTSKQCETTDTGVRTKVIYTITNNNDTPITIGEIGIISWPTRNSSYNGILLERTVLDAPVTIESGGVGQVVYNIDINYPA